jgi:hypothetical protein
LAEQQTRHQPGEQHQMPLNQHPRLHHQGQHH